MHGTLNRTALLGEELPIDAECHEAFTLAVQALHD